MHHAVEQCHIASEPVVYCNICVPGELNVSWVRHDELGPFFLGSENTPGNQGMTCRCIGPDDENTPGIFDLADRIRHCSASKGGGQTGHRGCVSEASAVIDVVGADDRSREFLCQIIFLVRHFCRYQNADTVRPVCIGNFF